MSQNIDQHWIDAVIGGDAQAFAKLVDRYGHMVFTLALKVLRNREEAEEVAQDVFLKVFQAISTFKGDSKFSTWLYKITYHRSLDYLKRKGRALKTVSMEETVEYHIGELDNTLERLDSDYRKGVVKSAIAALPEEDAIVLTLHYFESLSLKEIAEVLGITPENVKVRLFRSRKRLSALLATKLEPETMRYYGKR